MVTTCRCSVPWAVLNVARKARSYPSMRTHAVRATFTFGLIRRKRHELEFPIKELPEVFKGPRVERRRILIGGSPYWGTTIEGGEDKGQLRLDDGRLVNPHDVTHLPPVSPSKIIAIHISTARVATKHATSQNYPDSHVFHETAHRIEWP